MSVARGNLECPLLKKSIKRVSGLVSIVVWSSLSVCHLGCTPASQVPFHGDDTLAAEHTLIQRDKSHRDAGINETAYL